LSWLDKVSAVPKLLSLARVVALVGVTLLHPASAICAGIERANTMQTVTEADNERTIDLRVGEEVRITLPENATTGYRWAVDRLEGEVVEAVGSEPNYPVGTGGTVGTGGEVSFTFKGKKAGAGDIVLKYWRHFEGDSSITRRFHVRLNTRS